MVIIEKLLHRNVNGDGLEEQLNVEKFQPYRKTITLREFKPNLCGFTKVTFKPTSLFCFER